MGFVDHWVSAEVFLVRVGGWGVLVGSILPGNREFEGRCRCLVLFGFDAVDFLGEVEGLGRVDVLERVDVEFGNILPKLEVHV